MYKTMDAGWMCCGATSIESTPPYLDSVSPWLSDSVGGQSRRTKLYSLCQGMVKLTAPAWFCWGKKSYPTSGLSTVPCTCPFTCPFVRRRLLTSTPTTSASAHCADVHWRPVPCSSQYSLGRCICSSTSLACVKQSQASTAATVPAHSGTNEWHCACACRLPHLVCPPQYAKQFGRHLCG